MDKLSFFLILTFFPILVRTSEGDLQQNGICFKKFNAKSRCPENGFRCFNNKCIKRGWYCDNGNDCGDSSDEQYCDYSGECPPQMRKCPQSTKCILTDWICDGLTDCPNGKDETSCEITRLENDLNLAMAKALQWLREAHLEVPEKWGSSIDKTAVIFHLTNNMAIDSNRNFLQEISHGVSIRILSRLAKGDLKTIPSTELASYINALLVTCLDPRYFHGFDVVQELRSRADIQNYTNPYVFLSLCNAGETITESDKLKLINAFWAKHRPFWTDVQAVAVMALACASKQQGSVVDAETLHELLSELKQHQYRNGTVENLQTTALVLQAIFSMRSNENSDDFDEAKAFRQILATQKSGGSFGSFQNTYYVMPILNCNSLVNISTDHCQRPQRDGKTVLSYLANQTGDKIRVSYSIWIGNGRDLERNVALRVPTNTSFYRIMELAAIMDDRFRFEYVVKDRKPYVNQLSDLQDDPENGLFWFIYTVADGTPTLSQESPADILLKDNEHIVMWFRSGSWTS